jgi:hypothetical protein
MAGVTPYKAGIVSNMVRVVPYKTVTFQPSFIENHLDRQKSYSTLFLVIKL